MTVKVSGFTVARHAVSLGYPLVESIQSLLPLVDEYIVGIGDGDDGTWEAVAAIGDPRVKMFRSTWELSPRGGSVISEETNKALARCTGTWGVYLQADEVLHERDLPLLRDNLERYCDSTVEGLAFRYHHFYGSFAFEQDEPSRWYRRATRAVKLGRGIRSIGDGCAFGVPDDRGGRPVAPVNVPVWVYHYGWVRPPELMLAKNKGFDRLYHDEAWLAGNRRYPDNAQDVYNEKGNLRRFRGEHPAVMRTRAAAADWPFNAALERQPPEWIRRPYVYGRWIAVRSISRVKRGL